MALAGRWLPGKAAWGNEPSRNDPP